MRSMSVNPYKNPFILALRLFTEFCVKGPQEPQIRESLWPKTTVIRIQVLGHFKTIVNIP